MAFSPGCITISSATCCGARRHQTRNEQQQQGSLLAAPGGLDPSSGRARGAPTPEKVWAARNVARSLIGGGGSAAGAGEGVRMLREAAAECAEYYGEAHPGQLSTLLDLIDGLLALRALAAEGGGSGGGEGDDEAAAAAARALGVARAVAGRYAAQGDALSAAMLLESAREELSRPGLLAAGDAALAAAASEAAEAAASLDAARAARLAAAPRAGPRGALRALARDCTEEPLVQRAARRSLSRLDQFNRNLPLAPLG